VVDPTKRGERDMSTPKAMTEEAYRGYLIQEVDSPRHPYNESIGIFLLWKDGRQVSVLGGSLNQAKEVIDIWVEAGPNPLMIIPSMINLSSQTPDQGVA
jgi:hypothetical protein